MDPAILHTISSIIFGALIAIATTIAIENLRRPRIGLKLHPSVDMHYEDGRPAKEARFLSLELYNEPLPRWARWMSRQAALQCYGTVTFHHLDGQNVFGRAMPVRWSGSIEPVPLQGFVGDKPMVIFDHSRYVSSPREDVYPGEAVRFDIAARFDHEDECYGWCNQNYISIPIWRNPEWRLGNKILLVKITMISSGEKCTGIYRLINDVPQKDFRLEPALPRDAVRD